MKPFTTDIPSTRSGDIHIFDAEISQQVIVSFGPFLFSDSPEVMEQVGLAILYAVKSAKDRAEKEAVAA